MLNLPLHETADDPRAYRAERRAYERAKLLAALLVRATGGYEAPEKQAPSALLLEQIRRGSIAHFAELARAGRALYPSWQPSALLLRACAARSIAWEEVERAL